MADMGHDGDRYTDRYTDRCTALYCVYTGHADAFCSGMSACFACCGGNTAMVDARTIVGIQLSLAPLYQMFLLCGLLWVLTPLGIQRVKLTNSTGNCRVRVTLIVDFSSSVANSRSRAIRKSMSAQQNDKKKYESALGGIRTLETDLYLY